jgi:hypothetical protein
MKHYLILGLFYTLLVVSVTTLILSETGACH